MLKTNNQKENFRAGVVFTLVVFTMLLFNIKPVMGQGFVDIAQYIEYKPLVNTAASVNYSKPVIFAYGSKQWVTFDGSPSLFGGYFIYPLNTLSFGLSVKQQKIGVHTNQTVLANYTHNINLNFNRKLSLGLGLGAKFINSKYSSVNTTEQYDQSFDEDVKGFTPEATFGVFYTAKHFYSGISIPSLVYNFGGKGDEVNWQLSPENWKYLLLGGYNFYLNSLFKLDMSVLTRMNFETPVKFDLNGVLDYNNKISVGLSYRTVRELLFLVNFNINYQVKVGYCYHSYFGVSSNYLTGHEIVCQFTLEKPQKVIPQTPRF